jgi:hypothetical protein
MEDLINAEWRAFVRHEIPAPGLRELLEAIDFEQVDGPVYWCVEMVLDEDGDPCVVEDYELCAEDELPEVDEGNVLIACPIDESSVIKDLLEFDAAAGSGWEQVWGVESEDESDDE